MMSSDWRFLLVRTLLYAAVGGPVGWLLHRRSHDEGTWAGDASEWLVPGLIALMVGLVAAAGDLWDRRSRSPGSHSR